MRDNVISIIKAIVLEDFYVDKDGTVHPLIGAKLDERYDYSAYKDDDDRWRVKKILKNNNNDKHD